MNITQTYRNWRRYRTAVNELQSLSTRELDDLGIARGNIRQLVRHGH